MHSLSGEYNLGGEVSREADLYGYGILLLELPTSKRPIDDMFKEDFNFHMYAKAIVPDQVIQIIDSTLREIESEADDRGVHGVSGEGWSGMIKWISTRSNENK